MLTLSGSKGRTLHLLKETAKPVPKGKKRRKIAALDMLPVNPTVLIPNVNQAAQEESKDEQPPEEVKRGGGSKRNRTQLQPNAP